MQENGNNIPKIIHYCWFGDNLKSELMLKCIQSWKNVMPDWKFIEWNNDNISHIDSKFLEEAIINKKWAFASDYVRLWALYHQGGIYLDVDVEVLKSFDDFLKHDFFIGLENVTKKYSIGTATIGAKVGCEILKDLLDNYNQNLFIKPDGRCDLTPNPKRFVKYFLEKFKFSPQNANNKITKVAQNAYIYSTEYFSPQNRISKNTYAVHYFADSWEEDWCVKTLWHTKKIAFYSFKKQKNNAKELPLLGNEDLLLYLKISEKKSVAIVKKLKEEIVFEDYNSHNPGVSVIIIGDNNYDKFKLTFNSVISQFYQNYEIIIADISSSAKIEKFINLLPMSKIKYHHLTDLDLKNAEEFSKKIAKGKRTITFVSGMEFLSRNELGDICK